MTKEIDPALYDELSSATERSGCRLLEVENRGATLRLVVDRPEGVTLADCEAVSRQASALLDVADYGRTRYVLEVTSPGLDRKLYGPDDYVRFVGRQVRITWREAGPESKRTVVGRLTEFRPEGDEVSIVETDGTPPLTISLPRVETARLVPEF
jgi:ribosome maturation factor RimP